MRHNDANHDLLESYNAFHKVSSIMTCNKNSRVDIQEREIGGILVEHEDKLIIRNGKNKKEYVYLIPKTKVDHYRNMQVYFNIY